MKIVYLLVVLFISGCAVNPPVYDYSPSEIEIIDVNGTQISTAIFEIIEVKTNISSTCYYVRPGTYRRTGRLPLAKGKNSIPLFDGRGTQPSALCDRIHGLTVYEEKLCVVTLFEAVSCFESDEFKVKTKRLPLY
jgi:hypothetical protein